MFACQFCLSIILIVYLNISTFSVINASQYDQMVNLFDPNGELLQVKYAERASSKGMPLICFISEDCVVVLCRSPPHDSLLDLRTMDKVEKVDDDIWAAYCGLAGDGKSLIRSSRTFSLQFRKMFGYAPPVVSVARAIGDTQHEATLKGGNCYDIHGHSFLLYIIN